MSTSLGAVFCKVYMHGHNATQNSDHCSLEELKDEHALFIVHFHKMEDKVLKIEEKIKAFSYLQDAEPTIVEFAMFMMR